MSEEGIQSDAFFHGIHTIAVVRKNLPFKGGQ